MRAEFKRGFARGRELCLLYTLYNRHLHSLLIYMAGTHTQYITKFIFELTQHHQSEVNNYFLFAKHFQRTGAQVNRTYKRENCMVQYLESELGFLIVYYVCTGRSF